METKGNERYHQGTEGGSAEQRGGDQEALVPIETDRQSTGHRKGREQDKFCKNKFTEMSSGSDWHRKPPGRFGRFEMASEKSGTECWAGDREITEVGVDRYGSCHTSLVSLRWRRKGEV
jgi:hypothetical protein